MRWVFFCLLILNVVYLVYSLVSNAVPQQRRAQPVVAASAAPERLVLLSEVAPGTPPQVAATAALPALCPVVGPWADRAAADQAARSLRSSGYSLQIKEVSVAVDRLHWVFLPAQASRDEALRLLRELQAKGVDSFVVSDGADANSISLGYFSSADSARGLMVKMQTAGYPAEVRETARQSLEYWLQVDHASIGDEGAALRALLGATPTIRGNHVACHAEDPGLSPVNEAPPGNIPQAP